MESKHSECIILLMYGSCTQLQIFQESILTQFHRPEQAIDTASRSMKALTVSLFKSTAPPTFHVHSLNFIQISSILTRR